MYIEWLFCELGNDQKLYLSGSLAAVLLLPRAKVKGKVNFIAKRV